MKKLIDKFFDLAIPSWVVFLIVGIVAGSLVGCLIGQLIFHDPSGGTMYGLLAGALIAVAVTFIPDNKRP